MATATTTSQQQQQQQLPPAAQYRELVQECQQLMQKMAELEVDRNEHILVEETLKPLDGSRRAYRLVGDVLVERSVQEVLPSVSSNKANVSVKYFDDGYAFFILKRFLNIKTDYFSFIFSHIFHSFSISVGSYHPSA